MWGAMKGPSLVLLYVLGAFFSSPLPPLPVFLCRLCRAPYCCSFVLIGCVGCGFGGGQVNVWMRPSLGSRHICRLTISILMDRPSKPFFLCIFDFFGAEDLAPHFS